MSSNTSLENGESRQQSPDERNEKTAEEDPDLVAWSQDDTENPKNWSSRKRWAATFTVSAFMFISPVSSSMLAPAISQVAKDLHITSEVESEVVLSIFVLAYGFGPLMLGPLSEVFGRTITIQLASAFYFAWNLGCGFAQTSGQMIAFRFLAGLGGSAPIAAGAGVLGDCWRPHERGRAIAIGSMAPLLGPAIGPIAGAWIAQCTTWRWVFWSTCIASAVIQTAGGLLLPETYEPILLKRRAARLRKETGNLKLHTKFDEDKSLAKVLRVSLVRPFRLLATQPVVMVISLYMTYLFGLIYLLLSTFPGVFEGLYGESVGIAGLNYISLGLGFFVGAQIMGFYSDHIYKGLKERHGDGKGRPEDRIPAMFVGSVLIPIGFFWYGWSAQARVFWIMPNIGTFIYATGSVICMQCLQAYTIDTYTRYAASALAAATTLRSVAGFGFPLFAPSLYSSLGYGWGNSLLGFIGFGFCLAPLLFWRYGERLRAKSQFSTG